MNEMMFMLAEQIYNILVYCTAKAAFTILIMMLTITLSIVSVFR